ncbi:transposable element Tcb2 transposase [Trichonephila clavipes]|nr:transposable element Tcb2 transposase [Trichonephila clavipes]
MSKPSASRELFLQELQMEESTCARFNGNIKTECAVRTSVSSAAKIPEGATAMLSSGAPVQWNSLTVLRVWKKWTNEHRTTRKTGSGRWKVTSARDDQRLLRMEVKDRIVSSSQLEARWSTAIDVLMSASSIRRRLLHRGSRARCLYTGSPSRQTIRLRLQWAHEHRTWQADWFQVVFFSD